MNEEIKQKMLDWIYQNHMHHVDSTRAEMSLATGEIVMIDSSKMTDKELCDECDYPYVNSLELEKFIKSL